MQQRGQEDRDMLFLRAYGIDEVGYLPLINASWYYVQSHLSSYMSVCLVWALTFESLDLESSFLVSSYFQNI